jgi:predicted nucleic acid-binding protein
LTSFVVDASVAAKWFLEEPHTEQARSLLANGLVLHAPEHLLLEVDSILCKRLRRREMTSGRADTVRQSLRAMPIHFRPVRELLDAAYVVARDGRSSVYDGLYLALALALPARMVTDDVRLLRNLSGGPLAAHILWIGDFR